MKERRGEVNKGKGEGRNRPGMRGKERIRKEKKDERMEQRAKKEGDRK